MLFHLHVLAFVKFLFFAPYLVGHIIVLVGGDRPGMFRSDVVHLHVHVIVVNLDVLL